MAQLRWKVGALASCDIVIDHPKVSGTHLEIERSGDHYLVTDLDSSNGSAVNGQSIGSVYAQLTDQIELGPCSYTLQELLSMAKTIKRSRVSKASKTYPPAQRQTRISIIEKPFASAIRSMSWDARPGAIRLWSMVETRLCPGSMPASLEMQVA